MLKIRSRKLKTKQKKKRDFLMRLLLLLFITLKKRSVINDRKVKKNDKVVFLKVFSTYIRTSKGETG